MSVTQQNVGPAVVVEIEEARAPAQKSRYFSQTGLKRLILKEPISGVVIQAGRIAGKVGLEHIEPAVAIVIGHCDSHARLGLSVGGVSNAGLHGGVRERSIVIVPVERRRAGIVGDVNIRPAIVVEIGDDDAQAVSARGVEDACWFGNVGKRSVAIIVEEYILAALQPRWSTRHQQTFVFTRTGFRQRRGLRIEVDVVRDEQVEMAVLVIVDERAPGVVALQPALCSRGDAGLRCDIYEFAVAQILPQRTIAPVCNEQIVPAVVIEITDAAAGAPSGARNTSRRRHIGERTVAIVLVQPADWRRSGRPLRLEARPVHQKDVEPSVMVIVEKRRSTPGGLQQILVAILAAVNRLGFQSGFPGDVDELNTQGKRPG